MIRKLHVVVEVTLLLKGFSLWTKLPPVGKNPRENVASQIGYFVNNTLAKFGKVLDRFFTVLFITPLFLVRF